MPVPAFPLYDFTSGKATVGGEPNPDQRRYDVVSVVRRHDIAEAIGIKDPHERQALLATLRDQGMLVGSKGRLQHRVRVDPDDPRRKERHYVFACDPGSVS